MNLMLKYNIETLKLCIFAITEIRDQNEAVRLLKLGTKKELGLIRSDECAEYFFTVRHPLKAL